jgi:hypothetical protein
MLIYTLKFDRKKTAFAVVMAALLLIGVILLVGALTRRNSAAAERPASSTSTERVRIEKSRVAGLGRYGWEVESPARSEASVVIPRTFSEVFERYNELQKEQGFDLSAYCGETVTLYTYRVTNREYAGDEVLASLYVLNDRVIGGDVHSTALDGFICGVRPKDAAAA